MSSEYICRFLETDENVNWDALIGNLPESALFSKSAWLTPLTQIVGKNCKIAGIFKGEELMGGIPLQFYKRFNLHIASLPALTPYIGPVVLNRNTKYHFKNDLQTIEICDKLIDFLEKQYDYISFRTYCWWNDIRPFQWRGWKSKVMYTYRIEPPKIEIGQLEHSVRQKINKSESQNITVSAFDILTKDDLKRFMILVNKSFNRQEEPFPLTDEQFINLNLILQQNGISLKLYVAIMDEIWLAGRIGILHKDHVYGWVTGADPGYLKTGANQLLTWKCLEDWSQNGYKIFDFCGANLRSIAAYKATFGGKLTPYYQVEWAKPSAKAALYVKGLIGTGLHKLGLKGA